MRWIHIDSEYQADRSEALVHEKGRQHSYDTKHYELLTVSLHDYKSSGHPGSIDWLFM